MSLRGFQSYETFKAVIDQLTNNELKAKNIERTEENIMAFINKYERVATVEISLTFNLQKLSLKKF